MTPRYLAILAIGASFITFLAIAEANLKSTTTDTSTRIKAANLKINKPLPIQKENFQNPPEISARSAVAVDSKTGTILFEKNPNLKHLPASTTKLMTALVSLENCKPEQVVIIDQVEGNGTQMGLQVGDQITVENLLYGLLINSGNDAALTLSKECSNPQSTFVESMNQKARRLNMVKTHFTNPTGFDDIYQFSTAKDLAKLANVAIASPLISKIVSTKSTVVTDITGNKSYYLENINELLGVVEGIEGIKTGQTSGSLENLITRTTRNGNSIVVSVLGSMHRFLESQQLIEWAFANHAWINSD